MNSLLIEDIFIQICYQIKHVKSIVILEEVSKWHKKIVRKNKWISLTINVRNDENLIGMLKTHNFRNLFCSNVTDATISKLGNAHTLYLNHTKVTDESVSKLVNAHTLYLSDTKVTDVSVFKLVNAHTLDLSGTNVTDASVSKLVNSHTLNLSYTNVSNACIEKLETNKCAIYK